MTSESMICNVSLMSLAAMLLLGGCSTPEKSVDEEWTELFNGRNIDSWIAKIRGYPTGENFANTFRVDNGLLTVSYDAYDEFNLRFGHLFYASPFSHYRLLVEYRFVGEPAVDTPEWAWRNSGVMLHSQDPYTMQDEQDFPVSLEAQFLGGLGDGNPRPTANLCTPGTHVEFRGELTKHHCISSSSPTIDGDQWVTVEVLALGGKRFVHYVNGAAVIEYEHPIYGGEPASNYLPESMPDGQPLASGYIALQSEGHPIQFRRVALLNLKGCMDPASERFRPWYVERDPLDCRSDR